MRRNWLYFPTGGKATILYRVDSATNSQIWLSENGVNVLLGTYQLDHDISSTLVLDSHYGGVNKNTISGMPIFRFPVQVNYGSANSPATEFGNVIPSAFNKNIAPTNQNLNTAVGTSGGDLATANPQNDFLQSINTAYFAPSGEFQATLTSTLTYTSSVTGTTGTFEPRFSASMSLAGEDLAGGFGIVWPARLAGATGTDAGRVIASHATDGTIGPLTETLVPDNFNDTVLLPMQGFINGQINEASSTQDDPQGLDSQSNTRNRDYDHNYSAFQVKHRPTGSISKSAVGRFVTVEYYDAGVPKIDYYQIDNDLIATKATSTYPAIPTAAPSDPAPFWLTKTYNGSTPGSVFTLNNGQSPDPAFNVSPSGDLIEFLAYKDDLTVYQNSTVTLTRQVAGATRQVSFPGLGLIPDRVLGVADLTA